MDFASALKNLEKTAANAQQQRNSSNPNNPRNNYNSRNSRNDSQSPPSRKPSSNSDRRRNRPPEGRPFDRRSQRPRYDDRDVNPNNNNYNRARILHGSRGGSTGRDYHQGDHHPLDALTRFGYQMSPYQSTTPPADFLERKKHIALLAITIDDMPYEHIWREWAKQTGKNCLVSMLVHAKFPSVVASPWLKQRLLVKPPIIGRGRDYADPVYHTRCPEWGSVEITRAMIDLLATAMKIGPGDTERDVRFSTHRYRMESSEGDTSIILPEGKLPPVDKFIFISETCLPVATLAECEEALFPVDDEPNSEEKVGESAEQEGITPPSKPQVSNSAAWEVSWVNARNRSTPGTPRNKYERDQFLDIHRHIPQQYRWKADQWLVLSRPHAQAILEIDDRMDPGNQLWFSFSKVNASDEMYFPTALALRHILVEDEAQGNTDSETAADNRPAKFRQVAKRPVTYTDWTQGMRNPATFKGGLVDWIRVAKLARQGGCLFARKFVPVEQVPGKEPQRTGEIMADEWMQELLRMELESKQSSEESGKS